MQHLSSHFQHKYKFTTLIISSYHVPACTLYVCWISELLPDWLWNVTDLTSFQLWLTLLMPSIPGVWLFYHRSDSFESWCLTDFLQHVWTRLVPSSPDVWLFYHTSDLTFFNASASPESRCLTDFGGTLTTDYNFSCHCSISVSALTHP
jgi:hypothetical protein